MPTDEERREVATRLRDSMFNAGSRFKPGDTSWSRLYRTVFGGYMDQNPAAVTYNKVVSALADLIEPERRVCEQCGKPYYPTARDQRYCCKQCKKDHYISERLSREGEIPEYIAKVYGLEVEDAD